jgi:uncharacterized protein YceK
VIPLLRTLVLVVSVILLAGCDKISRKSASSEDPIFGVIHTQIKALNKRDAEGALAVMHPEAPGLAAIRESTFQITAAADLLYMIQSMSLESASDTEARVRYTQVTQKVSGPEFRNNRVTGIHTLRKYQGKWRLYSTEVTKVEFLDK